MNSFYFITDLDRTIIHSKNKGYKCVETIGDKEITYMTNEGYDKLQKLLNLDSFKFIPCTMRNINQTLRVNFIREYNPQIIICSNGAQIYINGELDKNWDEKMKAICNIDDLNRDISYLRQLSEKFKEEIKVLEVRNIENFYITIKCLTAEDAEKFYEKIKESFKENLKSFLVLDYRYQDATRKQLEDWFLIKSRTFPSSQSSIRTGLFLSRLLPSRLYCRLWNRTTSAYARGLL